MGSCFSKCRSKKKKIQEDSDCNCNCNCNNVQDKLVISQAPPTSPIPLSIQKPLPPPSPSPTSTSSFSSFSCVTNSSSSIGSSSLTSTLSSASSSSCSSSMVSSKDRSFSNEFLLSCAKENAHIIGLESIKKGSLEKSIPSKVHSKKLDSPAKSVAPMKQFIQEKQTGCHGAMSQKRPSPSSPTIIRQKSFRKESERPISMYSCSNRMLSSPSPSRRFIGDGNSYPTANTLKESVCKRSIVSKANGVSYGTLSSRKENFRPASPKNNLSRNHPDLRSGQVLTTQIGPKISEIENGAEMSNKDINSILMEDIDNPHIALDCFIFL